LSIGGLEFNTPTPNQCRVPATRDRVSAAAGGQAPDLTLQQRVALELADVVRVSKPKEGEQGYRCGEGAEKEGVLLGFLFRL
jgi:hypothetical protein